MYNRSMNLVNIGKRIWFETVFLILFPILMTFHVFWAMIILFKECFRIYPNEIFELTKSIVYGKEDT